MSAPDALTFTGESRGGPAAAAESAKYEPGSLPPGYQSYLGSLGRYPTAQNAQLARQAFDGKKSRRAIQRTTIDYNTGVMQWLRAAVWRPPMTAADARRRRWPLPLQPAPNYVVNMAPAAAATGNASASVAARFVHTSINKLKCPVNSLRWNPDGRRLITGSTSGEFTLWNGFTFNFETIMQAHDAAVRSMVWSPHGAYLMSADHNGVIKYWETSLNNVEAFQAHKESVRDLTFAPSSNKFASCSDDGTIKIWSFAEAREEATLTGHGWDVKCIDWHPQKALLASGSKDNLVKLWDPRAGRALTTLHGHKNTILGLSWNRNGNWLVTASRDQLLRVYDIRIMKELQAFRGHAREVNSVSWHPHEETLFASGGADGALLYWAVGEAEPLAALEQAHDQNIWALDWHPMGHLLCTGSNDHTTRFWARNRPGDDAGDAATSSHDPSVNPYLAASGPSGLAVGGATGANTTALAASTSSSSLSENLGPAPGSLAAIGGAADQNALGAVAAGGGVGASETRVLRDLGLGSSGAAVALPGLADASVTGDDSERYFAEKQALFASSAALVPRPGPVPGAHDRPSRPASGLGPGRFPNRDRNWGNRGFNSNNRY